MDLAVLLAVVIALLASCQAPPPAAPRAATPAADPLVRAREAVRRGDHAAAVAILRDVVQSGSTVLEAHYLLAVSASHIDQTEDARREFEWVVAHGEPGSTEVAVAREWLAPRQSSPVPPGAPSWSNVTPQPQKSELASVSGRAADASGPKTRLLLFLKGVPGGTAQDEDHSLRTDTQGQFEFANVAPGDYVLTNAVAGPATWRLRVSLTQGQRLVLDLSPSNDTTVRDDFREPPR